jgi:hypothetical protein
MLTTKKRVEFAICVANEGYDDLEVWKDYKVTGGYPQDYPVAATEMAAKPR